MNRHIICQTLAWTFAIALSLSSIGCTAAQPKADRWAMVTAIKPEKIDIYKQLHGHPWPSVTSKITECNIRNYSIYLKEIEPGKYYLFSYFEYVGSDFKADMAKMAADAEVNRWWKETDPCQEPIPLHKADEKIWSRMEEVFHEQ